MFADKTVAPILPAQNPLFWWGMWLLAAATLAVVILLVVLVARKVGWHLGVPTGQAQALTPGSGGAGPT